MSTWITICDTCTRGEWDPAVQPRTDGERLAERVESAAEGTDLRTRRVSCTMGCERACNVIVQAVGKIGYSLGGFEPATADAEAIVDYARKHAASETGQVPYRDWPTGVKGHFVSRHLPVPE